MVEIEKRAFITSIVIDIIEKNEENEGENEDNPFCEEKPKRIMVTFGIINPSKLQEGGEGGIIRQSVEAANLPDAMEELGGRISRLPFYGHTRLLILSEKLVRDKDLFMEVVDEFQRKPIINLQMKIVVFKGKTDEIKEVDPKLENLQTAYITGILDNSKVLSNTISMSLHQLITELRNNDGATAIPLLESKIGKESEFTIDKLALIKDYKLLRILDSKYIKTYKLLNGEFVNGRKLITYKGIVVPFYIFTAKKRTWLENDEEGLKFRVKILLEGDIEQFKFEKLLFDPKVIADVEKSVDEFVIKELDAATKYFQRDIESDYLGFKEYTNKYHYKVFKKYEGNWDEAFKNAEIVYEVEAKIRRIGTSRE
ncbi:MAG: Ger(x)C family spore germination protein [Clostridiales bacterium]|nr:Ger(x)C family spore germination protein [Clostridiales bacterium]